MGFVVSSCRTAFTDASEESCWATPLAISSTWSGVFKVMLHSSPSSLEIRIDSIVTFVKPSFLSSDFNCSSSSMLLKSSMPSTSSTVSVMDEALPAKNSSSSVLKKKLQD